MKYGEIIRKVYDVSYAKEELDELLQIASEAGFKKASGAGRRVGGSRERDALSEYHYINTRIVSLNRQLMRAIKKVSTLLNVRDHMLIHNFLHLQPEDFLDWQDYYLWKSKVQVFDDKLTA